MWYTVVITLVVDVGGLLLVYTLLRDRVRRATSAAAQMAELREEVSRLVVELNQTTERNVALLEDRISGLSDLLAAADRKIALLQREIEKHDVGVKVYSKLAEGASSSAAPQRQGPSRETLLREALPQEAPPRRQEPPNGRSLGFPWSCPNALRRAGSGRSPARGRHRQRRMCIRKWSC